MLRIRLATTADVPTIAHHRVQMFADMKVLPWHLRERLFRNDIETLVLHASEDGRQLYEDLGFQLTNEMRLVNTTRSGEVGTRA